MAKRKLVDRNDGEDHNEQVIELLRNKSGSQQSMANTNPQRSQDGVPHASPECGIPQNSNRDARTLSSGSRTQVRIHGRTSFNVDNVLTEHGMVITNCCEKPCTRQERCSYGHRNSDDQCVEMSEWTKEIVVSLQCQLTEAQQDVDEM